MSYKLYFHTGSENHGCEAIVRSTAKILGTSPILYSTEYESDKLYGIDTAVDLREDKKISLKKYSPVWFQAALSHKIHKNDYAFTVATHKGFFDDIKRNDIYFSIGGDNYCYPGQDIIGYYNTAIHRKGAKTVLWGCSVEPELLKEKSIERDIASYDLITTRESISYEALKEVNKNTFLISDPAFVLDSIELPLPEEWQEGNMVGINASPLILTSSANSKMVMLAYEKLIQYILEYTEFSIALIPHVIWKTNDDRIVLKQLYDKFKNSGRIILLKDYNCMELKGFIKRCRFFVGARTHATIAAYSTCVPTLVLGYSVKSRGIARDLFGSEQNYALPVQSISDAMELTECFRWICSCENRIKEHLEKIMPSYIQNAYEAREHLTQLIK